MAADTCENRKQVNGTLAKYGRFLLFLLPFIFRQNFNDGTYNMKMTTQNST